MYKSSARFTSITVSMTAEINSNKQSFSFFSSHNKDKAFAQNVNMVSTSAKDSFLNTNFILLKVMPCPTPHPPPPPKYAYKIIFL